MHLSASYHRDREYQRGAGVRSSHRAGRIDNGVEFAFTLGGLDARPCDGLNGGPTQVNQRDVFAIEGLVIIGVDTRPLGTVGVVRG